jgi:flagellin
MIINTNFASLSAQRNLATNSEKLATSVQRLSSGLRINSAKDDAAGLVISEGLRAQIRATNVAVRNAQAGISMAQTAEGAMQEVGNMLGRMKELAEQAASGTTDDNGRAALDKEYQALLTEIGRITTTSNFNGVDLLTAGVVDIQVGPKATDSVSFTLPDAATLVTSASNLLTTATAQAILTTLDADIIAVAGARGDLGATQNTLESTIANLRITSENLSAAESVIRDTDFAFETSQFTKNQILVQAGTAMVAQANVLPQAALQLLK